MLERLYLRIEKRDSCSVRPLQLEVSYWSSDTETAVRSRIPCNVQSLLIQGLVYARMAISLGCRSDVLMEKSDESSTKTLSALS